MKGKNNEDRYGVSAFQLSHKDSTPALLAVLSDGIGGHRAGEVASEIAVNQISQYIASSDAANPAEILSQAIQSASGLIFAESQNDPARQGMGATCACAWIIGYRLYAATVGDSRIYLVRGEKIYRLSTDHTWIQEAIELGILKPEDANGHPNAHIIRRYLGSPEPPVVDLRLRMHSNETDSEAVNNQGLLLRADDRLVLCSDGLTDLVSDEEIKTVMRQYSQEQAIEHLVDLANQRGGHDNITIVAVTVPVEAVSPLPVRLRTLAAAGAAALLLAVLGGALAAYWYRGGLFAGETMKIEPSILADTPGQAAPADGAVPQNQGEDAQPSPTFLPVTDTPARPTLPPVGGAGGATFTPWPTNTLLPTSEVKTLTPTP